MLIPLENQKLILMLRISFRVGDIVSINHRKMDPNKLFRVTKINSKNIKVAENDGFGRVYGFTKFISKKIKSNAQGAWLPRLPFVYLPHINN